MVGVLQGMKALPGVKQLLAPHIMQANVYI